MSSTNRGGKRNESDAYPTPPWVCYRLIDDLESNPAFLSGRRRWLEPCAGDGEIIRAVSSRIPDISWSACELRPEMRPHLEPLVSGPLHIGDLLNTTLEELGGVKFDVAITNPPFSIAQSVIKKCMELADVTIMLLRLNFWGSDERQPFLEAFPPRTMVLPNRPVFALNKEGKPGTDSPEYAWLAWGLDPDATHGAIKVLKRTPREERKKWTEHVRSVGALARELDRARDLSRSLSSAPLIDLDARPAFTPFGPDRDI